MKRKVYLIASIIFVFIIGFIYYFNSREIGYDLLPTCHVQGKDYFTHNPRDMNDELDSQYEYYGIIDKLVDDYDEEDLTTISPNYQNKEVYVDKDDDTYIYIKMDDKQYLRLQHEENDSTCYVDGRFYHIHGSLTAWQNNIPSKYKCYGVIDEFVDKYDNDNKKDLSTNEKKFMDKEVYVDSSDTKSIFIKLKDNQYLELVLVR